MNFIDIIIIVLFAGSMVAIEFYAIWLNHRFLWRIHDNMLLIYSRQNDYFARIFKKFEEIKRLVSINKYPKVYLIGETMDGKNLVYTLVRPELTADDISSWTSQFEIGGVLVKEIVKAKEIEALCFKVLKGTKDVRISVLFTDTSGNPSDTFIMDPYDALDTIKPPAPAGVTLMVREETEADADLPVIYPAAEPEEKEEAKESDPDGDTDQPNEEETEEEKE